jgi:phage shock protein A
MQARAGAIDELMASGALDDAVGGRRDDIQSELDMISASSDVENELSRLKGEIATSAPKQLEGSNGNAQAHPASVPATELPAAEPQDGAP